MRKEINLFLTTILLLFSICENCFSITRYVTSNLNLRYEANTHSYIITVIPKGTAVTIDETATVHGFL